MKKTVVKIVAIILGTIAIFGGCAKPSKTGVDSSGKIKLRFASWDSAENLDQQQLLVDNFNKSQDKITVQLEAYGGEYDTKISAGMGSGDTPDIMYMWDYPSYHAGLQELDTYVENEGAEYKNNFYEALWDYNSKDGKIYGIPVGFTTHTLFYNKDIFDQAGIEYPTNDWTWEDVKKASKQINEKVGVKGFSFPMKPDPYDYEMYLWSNGAAFVDKDGKVDGNLNSDKSIEVFTMFQDMLKDGYGVATEKSGTDEFRSGQSAMFVYGSWAIPNLEKDGVNYGIVDIPSFKNANGKSVSILSSSGLSIAKSSKNKEAAWEFIKYWTGEELNKARIGYELPALKSVVESENLMQDPKTAPFYSMLEQSSGYTPASFIVNNWSVLSETLKLSFERIYNPSTMEQPNKVLNEAVQEIGNN